ncbi:competence protein ComK [Peribacillus sp. SCS-37]|uniref:competence protein ComK n=1 Tax=Paraperibacillus esterisolvens TaxID=3115296 RepID=UPI003906AEE8
MEMKDRYIITNETISIKSSFDSFANHYSLVIQGHETFLVAQKPTTILNNSMLYYGTSLIGGIQSAKSILGNVSWCPVEVCSELDIYWFPLHSPRHGECIWLALAHTLRPEKISPFTTRINHSYGHSFTIDMKLGSFNKKKNNAIQLRHSHQQRKTRRALYFYEPQSGFQLISESPANKL